MASSDERIIRYRGNAEDEYGAVPTVVCPRALVLHDDDSAVLDDVFAQAQAGALDFGGVVDALPPILGDTPP